MHTGKCIDNLRKYTFEKNGIGSICCALICIGGMSVLIWFADDMITEHGVYSNIEPSECIVINSVSDTCNCGKNCQGMTYAYAASSIDCPGVTLTSEYDKCFASNYPTGIYPAPIPLNATNACYIRSCESKVFVWNQRDLHGSLGWYLSLIVMASLILTCSIGICLFCVVKMLSLYYHSYWAERKDKKRRATVEGKYKKEWAKECKEWAELNEYS
eukprot:287806_1